MADLSRRTLLKGLAAGASVVGWNALDRTWVAAATGAHGAAGGVPAGVDVVPPLDGTLETDPEVLADFAGDFGRLVTGAPVAVLRPGSVDDIVTVVRYARRHGLTVAMNGQSGTVDDRESHGQFGQALARGGIAIDARGLSTIHSLEPSRADVDAGVSWAEITDAAAAMGATPPMLTDFLHLSVGGTLSVGGIGGTVQKVGALVDNVRELHVVTGGGELVTCSRTRHRSLFDAVLAGAGQCAIIVRAVVDLVPVESRALVFNLFYDDLDTYLADSLLALDDGRFSYQEGQIVRRPDDTGWRYMLEVGTYYTPPGVPDQQALLEGLSDDRTEAVVVDLAYLEWVHRVDPAVVALRAAGFWDQPHPWVDLFVPASRAAELVESFVAELTPADLGAGLVLLYPFGTAKTTRPLFMVPREPVAFTVDVLRFPVPGHPDIAGLVAQNRSLHDRAVALGGKRYLVGAVPDVSEQDWRRHYGSRWQWFRAAKRRYDPDNILAPGQGIFTNG